MKYNFKEKQAIVSVVMAMANFVCRVTGMDAATDSLLGSGELDYDPTRILTADAIKKIKSAEKHLLGEGKK